MDMMRSDDDENQETVDEGLTVYSRFFFLLLMGFILVVVGMGVIFFVSVLYGGSAMIGSAVIFIGPFPIIIGVGPDITWIVFLSIILAVLSVVVFFIMNRKTRRFGN